MIDRLGDVLVEDSSNVDLDEGSAEGEVNMEAVVVEEEAVEYGPEVRAYARTRTPGAQ